MRALALAAVLVIACGALALQPADAAAQSPSTLSGTVHNGTAGGETPTGLRVTLRYQAPSGEVVEIDTTAIDGAFRFRDLPPQGNPGFDVRTEYQDVEYSLRRLGEPLSGPLALTVYETTNDFSVLSLVDDTLAVTGADGSERQFAALEAVKVRNSSDRTFLADVITDGPMSMVRFSLPENAADLDVEASLPGGHVLQVDRGFALTMPVPPGEHDILYLYRVPYEGSAKQYTPNFPMGTESFRVMIANGLAQGSGPGMRDAGPITIGDTRYTVLESGPLPPGMRAALTLSGLPEPTLLERAASFVRSDGFRRGALPGLVGVAFVALVGVVLLRRRPSVHPEGSRRANRETPSVHPEGNRRTDKQAPSIHPEGSRRANREAPSVHPEGNRRTDKQAPSIHPEGSRRANREAPSVHPEGNRRANREAPSVHPEGNRRANGRPPPFILREIEGRTGRPPPFILREIEGRTDPRPRTMTSWSPSRVSTPASRQVKSPRRATGYSARSWSSLRGRRNDAGREPQRKPAAAHRDGAGGLAADSLLLPLGLGAGAQRRRARGRRHQQRPRRSPSRAERGA